MPIFGKNYDEIIYCRLYSFSTALYVIHDKQFGFRKTHLTIHAINYLVDKIINELQKRNHVIGIFGKCRKINCKF